MTDLLKEYAKEIHGVGGTLTLEQLIESHRGLRLLRLGSTEHWLLAQKDGYAVGIQRGLASVNEEYIKIQDLQGMTLDQIFKMIYGEES